MHAIIYRLLAMYSNSAIESFWRSYTPTVNDKMFSEIEAMDNLQWTYLLLAQNPDPTWMLSTRNTPVCRLLGYLSSLANSAVCIQSLTLLLPAFTINSSWVPEPHLLVSQMNSLAKLSSVHSHAELARSSTLGSPHSEKFCILCHIVQPALMLRKASRNSAACKFQYNERMEMAQYLCLCVNLTLNGAHEYHLHMSSIACQVCVEIFCCQWVTSTWAATQLSVHFWLVKSCCGAEKACMTSLQKHDVDWERNRGKEDLPLVD